MRSLGGGLTTDKAEQYKELGFVVLRAALDPTTLLQLAADCTSVLEDAAPRSSIEDFGGAVASSHVPMLGHGSPTTDELVVSDALCAAAEALVGAEVFLDPLAVEAVSYRSVVPWHRDASADTPGVKLALYLDPLKAAEALLVQPGSHLVAGYSADEVARSGRAVAIETGPGDLVAFDLRLWHANQGPGPRRQWTSTYLVVPRDGTEVEATRAWLREGERYDEWERGPRPWLNAPWIRCQRADPRWARWIGHMEDLGRDIQ